MMACIVPCNVIGCYAGEALRRSVQGAWQCPVLRLALWAQDSIDAHCVFTRAW